jgi:hypothetical protein
VRALNPALEATVTLAPELRDVMVNIGPLTAASAAGFPAFERFLNLSVPFLKRAKPYLGGIIPILDYINSYRQEIAAFFANSTATTEATTLNIPQTKKLHYVRISNPVSPEVLAAYQHRLESNRPNPYLRPGGYGDLLAGLPVFGSYLCTSNSQPTIGLNVSASLAEVVRGVYFTAQPGGPPCRAQEALGTLTTGQLQSFPHLNAIP